MSTISHLGSSASSIASMSKNMSDKLDTKSINTLPRSASTLSGSSEMSTVSSVSASNVENTIVVSKIQNIYKLK